MPLIISIFTVYGISNLFPSRFNIILIPIILIIVTINQNNIAQINASQIHSDIHDFIKNNKINITKSKNVLFDTSSFKKILNILIMNVITINSITILVHN